MLNRSPSQPSSASRTSGVSSTSTAGLTRHLPRQSFRFPSDDEAADCKEAFDIVFESDDLEPFVKILQRYSVSRWAQWVDEENMTLVDVAEDEGSERCLYHMQQCLLRLVPPDGAGPYRIVLDETAVGPTAELGDIILELHTGTVVEVLEVVVLEKEQRVRGRLADPPGWISLMNMETGRRWAFRAEESATQSNPTLSGGMDAAQAASDAVAGAGRQRSGSAPRRASQSSSGVAAKAGPTGPAPSAAAPKPKPKAKGAVVAQRSSRGGALPPGTRSSEVRETARRRTPSTGKPTGRTSSSHVNVPSAGRSSTPLAAPVQRSSSRPEAPKGRKKVDEDMPELEIEAAKKAVEMEEMAKKAAEEVSVKEAERKAKEEAEREAAKEAERRAKEEAAKKAAEQAATKDAERKAKEEAAKKAAEEAAAKEAERRAQEEAAKKAAEEAAAKEAERQAKEEAERRAKEEAERRAKEEAAKKAAEEAAAKEAERRAKEEAERRANEETAKKAAEEAAAKEAARRAKEEEAEREAAKEAERRAKEEATKKAAEEAAAKEAVRRAEEEAELEAAKEAERRAKEEAELEAAKEAERRAKEEAAKGDVEREAAFEQERRGLEEATTIAAETSFAKEAGRQHLEHTAKKKEEASEEAATTAAEETATKEVERRAQEEAERVAAKEAERRAKEEAAQEEAAKKAAEDAAAKEAQRRAEEEAEREVAKEAERRAREEMAKKAAEEAAAMQAELRAKEEAEHEAAKEAERRFQEEASKKAAEEAAAMEAERRTKEEAEREAAKEAERRVEEAAKKAAEEAVAEEAGKREAQRLVAEEAELRAAREAAMKVAQAEAARKAERIAGAGTEREVVTEVKRPAEESGAHGAAKDVGQRDVERASQKVSGQQSAQSSETRASMQAARWATRRVSVDVTTQVAARSLGRTETTRVPSHALEAWADLVAKQLAEEASCRWERLVLSSRRAQGRVLRVASGFREASRRFGRSSSRSEEERQSEEESEEEDDDDEDEHNSQHVEDSGSSAWQVGARRSGASRWTTRASLSGSTVALDETAVRSGRQPDADAMESGMSESASRLVGVGVATQSVTDGRPSVARWVGERRSMASPPRVQARPTKPPPCVWRPAGLKEYPWGLLGEPVDEQEPSRKLKLRVKQTPVKEDEEAAAAAPDAQAARRFERPKAGAKALTFSQWKGRVSSTSGRSGSTPAAIAATKPRPRQSGEVALSRRQVQGASRRLAAGSAPSRDGRSFERKETSSERQMGIDGFRAHGSSGGPPRFSPPCRGSGRRGLATPADRFRPLLDASGVALLGAPGPEKPPRSPPAVAPRPGASYAAAVVDSGLGEERRLPSPYRLRALRIDSPRSATPSWGSSPRRTSPSQGSPQRGASGPSAPGSPTSGPSVAALSRSPSGSPSRTRLAWEGRAASPGWASPGSPAPRSGRSLSPQRSELRRGSPRSPVAARAAPGLGLGDRSPTPEAPRAVAGASALGSGRAAGTGGADAGRGRSKAPGAPPPRRSIAAAKRHRARMVRKSTKTAPFRPQPAKKRSSDLYQRLHGDAASRMDRLRKAREERARREEEEAEELRSKTVRYGSSGEVQRRCERLYGLAGSLAERKEKRREALLQEEGEAIQAMQALQRAAKGPADPERYQRLFDEAEKLRRKWDGVRERELREDMEELERGQIHSSAGQGHDAQRIELLYTDHFQRERRHEVLRTFKEIEEERELAGASIHRDWEGAPESAHVGQQRALLLYEEALQRRLRMPREEPRGRAASVTRRAASATRAGAEAQRSEVLYLDAVRRRVHHAARVALADEAAVAMSNLAGRTPSPPLARGDAEAGAEGASVVALSRPLQDTRAMSALLVGAAAASTVRGRPRTPRREPPREPSVEAAAAEAPRQALGGAEAPASPVAWVMTM